MNSVFSLIFDTQFKSYDRLEYSKSKLTVKKFNEMSIETSEENTSHVSGYRRS